jgi:hypothetical protein
MFVGNFHGTYQRPSTAETLKTIKQRHDESLRDYVKCFCNARNAIPHIQDIEIINSFRDGVSDIKTVEEIAMKKPKMVADLLSVADVCIDASEARARLLESCGKGLQEGRTIGRSILLNGEIGKTAGIKDSVENSPRIRKREDLSDDRMIQKSGVKFTAQQDMIWKSVKLFWVAKGCHHQHHQRRKSPNEAIIAGKIPRMTSIWLKSA